MKVLLAAIDIFSVTGGGQTFFSEYILSHPEVKFFFFVTKAVDSSKLPANAQVLLLGGHYRAGSERLPLDASLAFGNASLHENKSEVFLLLDMAASAANQCFDILEIPDYLPHAALLPHFLKAMGTEISRVALSMHGTLSDALSKNWAPEDIFDLESLAVFEDALYRSVDLRYGIGLPYVREWSDRTGLEAHHLDISTVFRIEDYAKRRRGAQRSWPTDLRPDLVFVGRQEKWKGPDLFVDFASRLAAGSYSNLRLIGPPVVLEGYDSASELLRMANRRRIPIETESLSRSRLLEGFANAPWMLLAPSRRDTFNLTCFEAILSGCPTALSRTTGLATYLREAWPDLPCLSVDPHRLDDSADAIIAMMSDYGGSRARLSAYLDDVPLKRLGLDIRQIWAQPDSGDEAIRGLLEDLSSELLERLDRDGHKTVSGPANSECATQIDEIFDGKASAAPPILKHLPFEASRFRNLMLELAASTGDRFAISDARLKAVTAELAPLVWSGNRVPVYDLLADLEERRGNDLLSATYRIRAMRLSGRRSSESADRVATILRTQGFSAEAEAVRWLHGSRTDAGEVRHYLDQLPRQLAKTPTGDIETVWDRRQPDLQPKASIIVSMYRAADKIPAFLRGLARMTERSRRTCELVLVDSCSPDETQAVVAQELEALSRAGTPLSTYYFRTSVRETIQKAWNRGLAAARADYVAFLGVDEMNRPDAFDVMIDYLDRNPDIDWVQGTALVTEVDQAGGFIRDIMAYDRTFDNQVVHLLDTCFIGYVGALYRKSIHDRAGYYDESFRGAGDTEFKNRALPFMRTATLPTCLGFFLNYPDERVTASPAVEIEDVRAWYLHRSPAAMGYHFDGGRVEDALELSQRCLSYSKTYLEQDSTDLELASSVNRYLLYAHPDRCLEVQGSAFCVESALASYRALDDLGASSQTLLGLEHDHRVRQVVKTAAVRLSEAIEKLRVQGWTGDFGFRNDNRSHQHFSIWPSTPANPAVTTKPHAPLLVEGAAQGAHANHALLVSPALTFEIVVDAGSARARDLICRVDGRVLPSSIDAGGRIVFLRAGRRERGVWNPSIELLDGTGAPVPDVAAEIVINLPAVTDPFTGDRALSAENLFYVEQDAAGRPTHRWTGPGCTAQLSIPIACRTEGFLEITIPHLGPNDVDEVKVEVDGRTLAIEPSYTGWIDNSTIMVPLPAIADDVGLRGAEIAIITARTRVSPGDDRAIGVAWSHARLAFPLRL